jgi:transcriptional regulator with XRE-family HTH domain
MKDKPKPPPEGILIKKARERARLSIREAARRAGRSETCWRYVENGYSTPAKGEISPARAGALTLAQLAQAVGVTPDALEKAERADAADKLRNLDDPHAASSPWLDDVHRRIDQLAGLGHPKARPMLESMVTMLEENLERP